MSPTLRLALCASVALHLAAVAALRGPYDAPNDPPLLVASLRAISLHSARMPASLTSPTFRAQAEEKAVHIIRQPNKFTPRVTTAEVSATNPAIVPGQNHSNVDVPIHTPAPSAGGTVAAAPLELPRFDADYLANPPPAYPPSARRRGIEGTVVVEARVGLRGDAQDVKLVESAGYEALDRAAIEAVRSWRFVPAHRGDQLVEALVRIPLIFRLN